MFIVYCHTLMCICLFSYHMQFYYLLSNLMFL